jgi:hypothetical protein
MSGQSTQNIRLEALRPFLKHVFGCDVDRAFIADPRCTCGVEALAIAAVSQLHAAVTPLTSEAVCNWLRARGYAVVADAIELGEQMQAG